MTTAFSFGKWTTPLMPQNERQQANLQENSTPSIAGKIFMPSVILPQRTWKPSCLKTPLHSTQPPPPPQCPWPSMHSQFLGHCPDWPKPRKKMSKVWSDIFRCNTQHSSLHKVAFSIWCNIYFVAQGFTVFGKWYFSIKFLVLFTQEVCISVRRNWDTPLYAFCPTPCFTTLREHVETSKFDCIKGEWNQQSCNV